MITLGTLIRGSSVFVTDVSAEEGKSSSSSYLDTDDRRSIDMPARTVLFDLKANPIHSFEPKPRNFISFQPQGRLFLNAGFGNLATGTVDVWDLKTRKKVSEFQAPNSTTCEWSPDGRFILTGTLSPRLRVDNGVKVWWCTGKLLHVQMVEELYQVGFLASAREGRMCDDAEISYFRRPTGDLHQSNHSLPSRSRCPRHLLHTPVSPSLRQPTRRRARPPRRSALTDLPGQEVRLPR